MRFRFCGDDQCPQWVTSEMQTLSQLKPQDVKLLTEEMLKSSPTEAYVHEKFSQEKMGANIEASHYQGSTAALHFIFSSAAKHDVSDTSLIQEMQQLGLPQDNATVIGAEYSQNKNVLRAKLFEDSYRLSQIMKAECSIDSLQSLEGKTSVLQFELLFLIDKKKREPVTSFNTSIDTSIVYEEDLRRLEKSRISLSKNSLELLISELTQAKALMKSSSKLDNINS